jgi:hypothetical protein
MQVTAKWVMGALAALVGSMPVDAAASDADGYVVGAYVLIVGGGVTTSTGMQVNLLRGEPDLDWARAGACFGGANAALGAGFLIASGIVSDDDLGRSLAILGGSHFAIAAANTLWGLVTYAQTEDALDLEVPQPAPAGLHYRVAF